MLGPSSTLVATEAVAHPRCHPTPHRKSRVAMTLTLQCKRASKAKQTMMTWCSPSERCTDFKTHSVHIRIQPDTCTNHTTTLPNDEIMGRCTLEFCGLPGLAPPWGKENGRRASGPSGALGGEFPDDLIPNLVQRWALFLMLLHWRLIWPLDCLLMYFRVCL